MPSHLLSLNPHLDPQTVSPSLCSYSSPTTTPATEPPTKSKMDTDSDPQLRTYKGNCHCGAFKYTVSVPEITSVNTCSCSVCFKKGYRWIFPGEGLEITKGEGTLKEYAFAGKTIKHLFCGVCGTGVLGVREAGVGVNAGTIEEPDFDVFALKASTFDGAALAPQYKAPQFSGTEPVAEIEDAKMYYGGCHCGAVTVAMKTEGPLEDGKQRILECDCSICTRDGTTLTYPLTKALTIHDPSSALTTYSFGRDFHQHKFCSVCGVTVYIKRRDHVPEEDWKKSKGDADQDTWRQIMPVNLRCFEGVDWNAPGLVERISLRGFEPIYVCPE